MSKYEDLAKKAAEKARTGIDPSELWDEVMAGRIKQHNEQMSVVIALWKNGDIEVSA